MKKPRRVLPLVVAALLLALTATALAAKPGLWGTHDRSFLLEVGGSGKRIVEFSWDCTSKRSVDKQFAKGKGPRIVNGRFSWSGRARVITGGLPKGHTTLTVSGRFTSARRATVSTSAGGCKAETVRVKPTTTQLGQL